MKDVIEEALKFLCVDTLGFELSPAKTLGKGFYGASIGIYKGDDEFSFYLFFKKDTLKKFAFALLGTKSDLDDIDLDDLCKELANQIIGKVKNLLNEKHGNIYTLATPEFLGEVDEFNIKLTERFIYKIQNRTFYIGYKKI